MAKKSVLQNNPLFNTAVEADQEAPKMGRPRKSDLVRDNSVQAGLTEDLTRATFILKVDTLNDLKDYAYTKRITIKEALDEIITDFMTKYKAEGNELLQHKK